MYIGRATDHLHCRFRTVLLNRARGRLIYPWGTAKGQCLETCEGRGGSQITDGELLLASSGEVRDPTKYPAMHKTAHPQWRIILPKISVVPRLALEEPRGPPYLPPILPLTSKLTSRNLKLRSSCFGLMSYLLKCSYTFTPDTCILGKFSLPNISFQTYIL